MGIQIIVTIQTQFEYEVHQSGLGLFRKFAVQGVAAMWWDIQQEEFKIVPRLVMQTGDCSNFDGASVYVISHGSGFKVAGLAADVFAGYLELLLNKMKCPDQAKLDKLCLVACNAGRLQTSKNNAPPTYLGQIASSLKVYDFARIIAWNSWVTVYSFRHIANLCVKHREEILQEAMKFIKQMSSDDKYVVSLSDGLLDDLKSVTQKESVPNLVLHSNFKSSYLSFLDQAPLEVLLALVGKKLVQANQGPIGKRFSNSSSPVGLSNVLTVSDTKALWRRKIIYEMFRKKLNQAIAEIIADYDAMWAYYPQKMKICLMDSKAVKMLGYDKL